MSMLSSGYPYAGPQGSGIMQDPQSLVGASSAHMSKRRRLDEPTEGYDHHERAWDENPQPSTHAPGSGTAALSATDGSAWPPQSQSHQQQQHSHSDSLAYPDPSFQQQPYFYGQASQPSYNSTWAPTSTSQSYGDSASSLAYTVGEPSASAAMPYFPPPVTANGEDAQDVSLESANNSYQAVPNLEVSSQYASYTQPSHTAALAQREAAKSSAYYLDDASMHLKIQSLPILDNLATQLIHTISKASFPQIQDLMRGANDSEDIQAYKTLKNLFDQTRKVYSRETPFIDAIAIQMFQPNQQEIIRKANIATFISSILGAHDVSFFHLNEFFMETFVPLGHRLLKWQGAIYLDLKTQIYISALMNSDGSPEAMLDELFPPDLDAQILTRHPDAPSLSPSEQDFIDRSKKRKKYLLEEPSSNDAISELPKKYQWNDFVREFASCITKNADGIMNVPVRAQAAGINAAGRAIQDANGANGNSNASFANTSKPSASGGQNSESRKAAAAASTQRQPWTKPEEDALLSGLERVNGPHWSQILALYGRGGSVSEVLKDRNQVQLKDKARNLKLWYLKTGKEVPPALRGVTGELRKRGGARARAALGLMDDDEQSGGGDAEDEDAEKEGSKRAKKKSAKK